MSKKNRPSGGPRPRAASEPTAAVDWKPYIFLAALALLVFGRVLTCDFIAFDDQGYVTENKRIQSGLTWSFIQWAFTSGYAANWHPLTWFSHMLDYQLYGLKPWGHHLTNLLFHVANTLLVFALFRRATNTKWPSLIMAMIFAVHPVHVESVAWVSERKDVLSAFFGLLALNTYVAYGQTGRMSRYWATMILFVLGLMSKPMLVTLPFVLLLLDVWPLGRIPATLNPATLFGKDSRRAILEKVPLLALSVLSSAVTVWAQHGGGAVASVDKFPILVRIQNTFAAYFHYFWTAFWPSRSSIFYHYPHDGVPGATLVVAVVLVVGGSVAALIFLRRAPWVFAGWFLFLGMLVPVIGLVQVGGQAHADRYMYLPLIGLSMLAVFTLNKLIKPEKAQWVAVIAIPWLLLCLFTTFVQIGSWQTSERLWMNAYKLTERNGLACQGLGNVYADSGASPAEAIKWYQKGAEYGDSGAQYNLGLSYAQGYGVEKDMSEAVRYYRASAEGGEAIAQFNLAYQYMIGQGTERDPEEGAKWYLKAAEQEYPKAQFNIGQLYAMGDGVPRDLKKAFEWYQRAAAYGDDLAQLFLGRMYESGEAGPKDLVQACMLYTLSAKTCEEARGAREKLVSSLTPEQIAQAEQMAREWRPLESEHTKPGKKLVARNR